MPGTTTTTSAAASLRRPPRSRARRAGESAFGMLLLARLVFMGLLVVLLVTAGAWASWQPVSDALASGGQERGTLTVRACDAAECTGTFQPSGEGSEDASGERVELAQPLGRESGERLSVALREGSGDEVVRTGLAGVLYACLPLTGALLLASLVMAGGLRLRRTAWATAGIAVAALATTFAVW